VDELRALLRLGARKLLAARAQRPTPFIDRTLYTGWNAMAVTAYLETARVLRMDSAREFALRTLDRLLDEAWDGDHAQPRDRLWRRRARQEACWAAKRRPARSTITPSPFTPASTPGWPAAR
jgi:uncharacterized protein YyaL (SSP411 family)